MIVMKFKSHKQFVTIDNHDVFIYNNEEIGTIDIDECYY